MSQPPPYPGDEKSGYPAAPPNPAYPPPQAGYAPPPAGYPQPPPQGFVPPTGYAQPPPGGYAPPPQGYGPPQQGYGPPPQGYAPPPQGYAPAPGQQYGQTTVVVAQPTMSVVQQFRETPVHTRCPHCSAEIVTAAHYETGSLTWIICLVLCLVGCDFGCCLIPFCVDGCKDVIHSCPNCRQTISRYSRM